MPTGDPQDMQRDRASNAPGAIDPNYTSALQRYAGNTVAGEQAPASIGGSSLGWQVNPHQTWAGDPPPAAPYMGSLPPGAGIAIGGLYAGPPPLMDHTLMQMRMQCLEIAMRISTSADSAIATANRLMMYVQHGYGADPL